MSNNQDNIVSLENIHFSYGARPVHTDLSLDIERGFVTTIMGPSGCGKSTILSLIGGRIKPQRGKVLVDGFSVPDLGNRELYELRKKMGMMFQHNALLTDLSVFENVAFPLREHTDMSEDKLRETVLSKLEMVGLHEAAELSPEECSGGMQRRVALARAIVMSPQLIMYDEPFTGLDPISKGVITKLIREMNDILKITSIIVTHDIAEACEISNQIYVLANGKVLGKGSPDKMMNSKEQAVKQFMTGAPDGPVAFHYVSGRVQSDIEEQPNVQETHRSK